MIGSKGSLSSENKNHFGICGDVAIQAQPLVSHHSGERMFLPSDLKIYLFFSSHHHYYYHYYQLIIAVLYFLPPTAVKIQPWIHHHQSLFNCLDK